MQESPAMIPARKVNFIYPSAKSSKRFNPWPIIVQAELTRQGNQWIWKDGKGGFKEFLASLDEPQRTEVLEQGTINQVPVFTTTTRTGKIMVRRLHGFKMIRGNLQTPKGRAV